MATTTTMMRSEIETCGNLRVLVAAVVVVVVLLLSENDITFVGAHAHSS